MIVAVTPEVPVHPVPVHPSPVPVKSLVILVPVCGKLHNLLACVCMQEVETVMLSCGKILYMQVDETIMLSC